MATYDYAPLAKQVVEIIEEYGGKVRLINIANGDGDRPWRPASGNDDSLDVNAVQVDPGSLTSVNTMSTLVQSLDSLSPETKSCLLVPGQRNNVNLDLSYFDKAEADGTTYRIIGKHELKPDPGSAGVSLLWVLELA